MKFGVSVKFTLQLREELNVWLENSTPCGVVSFVFSNTPNVIRGYLNLIPSGFL
jgi:hypothetical protein